MIIMKVIIMAEYHITVYSVWIIMAMIIMSEYSHMAFHFNALCSCAMYQCI